VTPGPVREAVAALQRGERVALLLLGVPGEDELVGLARAADIAGSPVPLAVFGGTERSERQVLTLAADLGVPVLHEVGPLVAALALLDALAPPFEVGAKGLEPPDRRRLEGVLGGGRGARMLEPADAGRVALAPLEGEEAAPTLGEARDVVAALEALRASRRPEARPRMPRVEGVEPQSVLDVILGPPRVLSDPASKAALAAYDVPLPLEELCSSPSRAASEATRIGFPVRVALASPDLRVWDHPDLVAERVENATRVRDVFRQIMALARGRDAEARLLGVTVSATRMPRARLRVQAAPLAEGLVRVALGFADPHGVAAGDETALVLPCSPEALEAALRRLRGHPLLLGGTPGERRDVVAAIGDTLLRVAAFLDDWRSEVEAVELRPLALLVGGEVEIREASVTVSDAFARSLETMPAGR
ncbi:MAG TPA: acetate--CoA ligase family protein, partial [Polyangiaceae bacterium LLY-WYZ-15_(1-7)]|nr:acetate--CoA ligase family protein [Polyangiaceae bacterium LLY-WYZ-15_(1-7)]